VGVDNCEDVDKMWASFAWLTGGFYIPVELLSLAGRRAFGRRAARIRLHVGRLTSDPLWFDTSLTGEKI
jgi:hypothetical protein